MGLLLSRRAGVEELRELDGDVVLVHGGHLLALNGVGTRIWDLLAEPRTPDGLAEALSRRWPGARVADDVPPFLARLGDLGLLTED